MLEVIRETNLMIQIYTLTDRQTAGQGQVYMPHPPHLPTNVKWENVEINILALDVL